MVKQQNLVLLLIISLSILLQQHPAVVCSSPTSEAKESFNRRFSSHRVLLSHESENYAVIFDAGSTGTRVHVFRFDPDLNLLRIGNEFELFASIKPGLGAYASDPDGAARSIEPLLEKAEAVIPEELHPYTPIKVGATAGLRLLKGDAPEKILEAVRELIKSESSFKYKAEWITILEGTQEASYLWVAMNYLLGRAGKDYSETVGTIDMGGGSMQMTYALSEENAAGASNITIGGKNYVQQRNVKGKIYQLYTYSYLNYGLLAARAEILKVSANSSHPCIVAGYDGTYTYNGAAYTASSLPSGSDLKKCRTFILKAMKMDAPCEHKNCTFNGVWNGGGGAGQKNLYVQSYFFDKAKEIGMIPLDAYAAVIRPADYLRAANRACVTEFKDVISTYPNIVQKDAAFVCSDLVYFYTVLVDGFGLNPFKKITISDKVEYNGTLIEAAWALGSAIDVISSQTQQGRALHLPQIESEHITRGSVF